MSQKNRIPFGVLAVLGVLSWQAGCNESPGTLVNSGASESSEQVETANAGGTSSDSTAASNEFLPAPDGAFSAEYEAALAADGEQGLMMLADVSHEVGLSMAQQGKEVGYDYILQSARLVRKLAADGASIPDSFQSTLFYNVACAWARKGETDKSLDALEMSVEKGFDDLTLLQSDGDLANVRESSGFAQRLADFKAKIDARMMEQVSADLERGKTYPFDFAVSSFGGEELSLEQYRGKVVIVDFWGTWCPPCRAEIPSFIELQNTFGEQGLQIVGLNYENGDEAAIVKKVNEFVAQQGINYPCAPGTDELREQVPNFRGFPTTVFIDRQGKVRMTTVGLHGYAYLEAAVKLLLDEPAA